MPRLPAGWRRQCPETAGCRAMRSQVTSHRGARPGSQSLGEALMPRIAKWLVHPSWIVVLIIAGLVAWTQLTGPTGDPPPGAEAPRVTAAGMRSVSDDGRFRVFQSVELLTAGDDNDRLDVFV